MWKKFKDELPNANDPKPLAYLVIPEGCSEPCIGYYDWLSKRFYIFVPHIGRCIQVPVTHWLAVPFAD